MKLPRFLLTVICLFAIVDPLAASDLLVTGGHYFDVSTKQFVINDGIAIKDGEFVAIGKKALALGIEERLELADDDYILPGLIDIHAHYNVKLFRKRREEYNVMPAIYLANGSTVTFSAGEFDPEAMQKLRQEIESGSKIGPRLINSGPYFGTARPQWNRAITADQIRAEVKQWAPKVGGFKAKQIRPEHLKVLIEAAHEHGLTVTGHLDSGFRNTVNPLDAIDMGIDRIEHFIGGRALVDTKSAYATMQKLDPMHPDITAAIRRYVEEEVFFDATISAYGYLGNREVGYEYWVDEREFFTDYVRKQIKDQPRKNLSWVDPIYDHKQKTIKRFFDAGGLITTGTDHVSDGYYLPGFGIHRELEVLVRSGIPPADALVMGTINGAKALNIEDRHGSIETGKSGDLLIVSGNPAKSILCTRRGKYVIRAGAKHVPQQIFDQFKGKLGPTNEDERSDW